MPIAHISGVGNAELFSKDRAATNFFTQRLTSSLESFYELGSLVDACIAAVRYPK